MEQFCFRLDVFLGFWFPAPLLFLDFPASLLLPALLLSLTNRPSETL